MKFGISKDWRKGESCRIDRGQAGVGIDKRLVGFSIASRRVGSSFRCARVRNSEAGKGRGGGYSK